MVLLMYGRVVVNNCEAFVVTLDPHFPYPPVLSLVSLFIHSDEVSGLLLSELGMSSITAAGVRHAPSEVIGGETRGEGAKLRAKVDWDAAARTQKEGTGTLEACAEGCRQVFRGRPANAVRWLLLPGSSLTHVSGFDAGGTPACDFQCCCS